jgi:hypothetical protein
VSTWSSSSALVSWAVSAGATPPKLESVATNRVRWLSSTSAYRRGNVVDRHRAMGREGIAVRSWGREALRHTRFAAGPARRAKETGMVVVSLPTSMYGPQWACRVESEVVALEGSFPHIDDATRLSLPPLAGWVLARRRLPRTFCEHGKCSPPSTPNLTSTPQPCRHRVHRS